MAFKDDDSQNLSSLAKHFQHRKLEKVRLPAGDNSDKDIQYSEMDMIAGICSAALFGQANKDNQSVKTLISNPNKSYLYSINNILQTLFGSPTKSIISDDAIKVKITDIASKSIKMILQSISDTGNKSPQGKSGIDINLNGINNIDKLNEALEKLSKNTNDKGLTDGIIGLINTIQDINKLTTTIDSSVIIENIQNLIKLSDGLNNIQFKNIDPETIKNLSTACVQIIGIINQINQLPNSINNIDIFNDDKLINVINGINKTIDILNDITYVPNENTLKNLNNFISNNTSGLSILISNINTLLSQNTLNISDIKGLGELIEGIISIAQFNSKIEIESLSELSDLLEENGIISNILKNINKLGAIAVSSESIKALNYISSYFQTISELTDIGLIGKIRIITNLSFFKYYINKSLPGLIRDIEKNFAGLSLTDQNSTLNKLQKYFSVLKSIASLSIKDQINLIISINTIKTLVIDELAKIVKDINTKFKDIDVSKDVTNVFSIFDKIKSIAIPQDFKQQRKGLKEIHKFLFGSSPLGKGGKLGAIGRGFDYIKGNSSILSIVNRLKEESTSFSGIQGPLDDLKDILTAIIKIINTNFNEKKIIQLSDSLEEFNYGVLKNLKIIAKNNEEQEFIKGLNIIHTFTSEINKSYRNTTLDNTIQKIIIGKDTYKNFKETIKLFNELPNLIKAINLCEKLGDISIKALQKIEKLADSIKLVVDKFAGFDDKQLKAATKVIHNLMALMIINTALLLVGAIAMAWIPIEDLLMFLGGIYVMTLVFKGLINLLTSKDFKEENLQNGIKILYDLTIIVAALGITLALCSRLMKTVKFEDAALFVGGVTVLVGLMIGILFILNKFGNKLFKDAIPAVRDLAILVIACGLSLALASFIGQSVSIGTLFTFGILLMGLILSVMVPLIFFNTVSIFMFKGVHELGILILCCTLSLILAGLVSKYIDKASLALFTGMLTFLISGILLSLGLFGGWEVQGAKELGQLVMYCAGAMLIGGLLFMWLGEPFKQAVKDFSDTLFKFTAKILLVIGLAAMMGGESMQHMKNLNKIIIVSAATILIGGLLFLMGGQKLKDAVNDFALTLFLFIGGISLCVALVGAIVDEKRLAQMWQLALLVFVSALSITLGPILLKEYGVSIEEVQNFVGMALCLVGGISLIVGLLGLVPKRILKQGIIAMATIEALIFGLGLVIGKLSEAIEAITSLDSFWEGLGKMTVVIGGITAIVAALGGILMIPGAKIVMALGAAALATIEGLIFGLSRCILTLVDAIKALDTIKGVDIADALSPFFGFLYESKDLLTIFGWDELAKIKGLTTALSGMGSMISNIAIGVQNYANLKVAEEWDPKTGKPTKFRHLTVTDFALAGVNIGLIISTIGKAILKIYQGQDIDGNPIMDPKDAKEMFASSWFSGSRFDKVVKSVSKLGGLISNIAKGIQDYANLKIPIYDKDGKIIKYDQFDETYFKKAAENIAIVITTLGMSIMAIYNGKRWDPTTGKLESLPNFTENDAKLMFTGDTWISSSPFNKVVKSTSKLGGLISSLAKGIQDYATLAIPTKWNEEGKPTAWERMSDTEFTQAGENIGKVIMSLGQAVMAVAKDAGFWTLYDPNRIKNIVDAIGKVSNFIGPLSHTMIKYATGKFYRLEYKDGKLNTVQGPEGLVTIDQLGGWKGLQEKLTTSVSNVLLGLGKAINKAMEDKDLKKFQSNNDKLSTFITNMQSIANMMKTVFDNIKQTVDFNLTDTIVNDNFVNPFTKFISAFDMSDKSNLKYIFDNDNDAKVFANTFDSYANTISKLFKTIKEISDAKISLTDVNGKTIFEIIIESCATSLKTIKTFNYSKETSNMMDMYSDDINKLIQSIKKADEEFLKRSNILTNGILAVYIATSIVKSNDAFAGHAETMAKYVESINSIDVSKVESLTNLTYAVTTLGKNIKDIDKFTEVIATKIAKVLARLSQEMNFASNVIKRADNLHKQRQNAIKSSITKITELMDKEMIVKIENEQPPVNTNNDAGAPEDLTNTPETNNITPDITPSSSAAPEPTVQTSRGNSNSSQRISVDINVESLATAIAKAFKKIK